MVKTHQFSNGQNAENFKWSKRKILKPSKHINGKTVKMKKKNPAYGRQSISTDADSSTDTTVGLTKNTPKPIFLKNGKNHPKCKKSKTSRNMPKLAIRPLTRGL